jgi:hypothetical protein
MKRDVLGFLNVNDRNVNDRNINDRNVNDLNIKDNSESR